MNYAIINIDDEYSKRILEKINTNIITYGFKNNADVFPLKYTLKW